MYDFSKLIEIDEAEAEALMLEYVEWERDIFKKAFTETIIAEVKQELTRKYNNGN